MKIDIFDFGTIDTDNLNFEYLWSGYAQSMKQFIEYNFLDLKKNGKNCLVCNSMNGLALAEFLIEYVLDIPELEDLLDFMQPDMNYWFLKRFEACDDELENSEVCGLVDILLEQKIIYKLPFESKADSEFDYILCFPEYEKFIQADWGKEINKKIYEEIIEIAKGFYSDFELDEPDSDETERKEIFQELIKKCNEKISQCGQK